MARAKHGLPGVYNATALSLSDEEGAALALDSSGRLILSSDLSLAESSGLDAFETVKCAPTAFVGGTENARGDDGGTSDPTTLFTVTGDVLMGVYGVCTVLLDGAAATVSVGLVGNTALFLPVTTATDIDANEIWMDATPAIGKTIDSLTFYAVGNGVDVIETVATANVTEGNIYYICLWKPLTAGSTVVSAV